jgi:hypothetical protein
VTTTVQALSAHSLLDWSIDISTDWYSVNPHSHEPRMVKLTACMGHLVALTLTGRVLWYPSHRWSSQRGHVCTSPVFTSPCEMLHLDVW